MINTPPNRPPVAFRVSVWHGNIKPEHRDASTLSDGAIFRNPADALAFQERVTINGGKVAQVKKIINPRAWYESLDEFDRLGSMNLAELEALRLRWEAEAFQSWIQPTWR